jgi:nucleotide-binding universal stress UspA family protein
MQHTAAFCFDGIEDEELVHAAKDVLPATDRVEAWCAYGHAAEDILSAAADRHRAPHRPPPPPHHRGPDEEQATAIAQRGAQILMQAGYQATTPHTLAGTDPGHAIADASRPDVIVVVAAGHRRERGPKSIGHVARFVIDHAGGPVLVLRLRD